MCGAVAQAQQPAKVPRIGFVTGRGDSKKPGALVEAFRQGLRDLGYIDGKTLWLNIATLRGSGPSLSSGAGGRTNPLLHKRLSRRGDCLRKKDSIEESR
jgi:hypothetical protein